MLRAARTVSSGVGTAAEMAVERRALSLDFF